MPFVANTPESFMGRSDSKNPATTCRGITSSGRPCRRPVSLPTSQSLIPTNTRARFSTHDPRDERLYCWQHKEQASHSARSSPGPRGTSTPILEERTSLDTLADRLGLVELEQPRKSKPYKTPRDGRLDGSNGGAWASTQPVKRTRPKEKKELQFCFCFKIPIEEIHDSRPVRPQPRPVQQMTSSAPALGHLKMSSKPKPVPTSSHPNPRMSGESPTRKPRGTGQSTSSQTARYLSLIPHTTDPQTASLLMAELARPYVESEEPGFIYMFWMTSVSETASAPVEAAKSLLAPPSPAARPDGQRRPSDVVSAFANVSGKGGKGTMLLKIGRAANVQRRMNQWSRQCGYEVEVIRYYPYIPGASEASGTSPRMTPHCHRVERLIHIELAGLGLRADRDACQTCGKEHREWFETDASRHGIRTVDEVIRRWVSWDEGAV